MGIVAFSGCTQTQQNVPQNTVLIQNFAFNPNNLTVKVGTTVTWINQESTTHDVISDDGTFSSPPINNGANYTFTFTKAGEYPYHCGIHPSMKAKIIVQ
ncbi:MAG: cupredoxin family copper-binding protein [Methanobacterium sp.]|nr:cupredoxin family copper-binding protein [Methanobacterium sp.]